MDPGARRHADTSTSRSGFSHTASLAGGTRTPEEARGEPGQAAASRHAGPVVIVSQGDSLDPHLGRTTASAAGALFGWTTPRTHLQLATERRTVEPWTGAGGGGGRRLSRHLGPTWTLRWFGGPFASRGWGQALPQDWYDRYDSDHSGARSLH